MRTYSVEHDQAAPFVYTVGGGMYCTLACVETGNPGADAAAMLAEGSLRRVPMIFRHVNPFADAAIARACCDSCGFNLSDLKAPQLAAPSARRPRP